MKQTLYLLMTMLGLSCCDVSGQDSKTVSDPNVASASLVAAGKCDESVSAFIPKSAVGVARLLGSTQVRARTILDPVHFSTQCPVPLKWVPEAAHPKCGRVNLFGARMAISHNALANAFTMHIDGSSTNGFAVPGMVPGRDSHTTSGASDYLVGTLLEENGVPERKYFVYFKNTLESSDEHANSLEKVYRIQVYEKKNGSYECPEHMPDYSAEDEPQQIVHKEGTGTGGGVVVVGLEAGTGGGVEPRR